MARWEEGDSWDCQGYLAVGSDKVPDTWLRLSWVEKVHFTMYTNDRLWISFCERYSLSGSRLARLVRLTLGQVSSWYTLVIFTASMPEYADPVIDWLDAGRGMFSRRLFREVSCSLEKLPALLLN